MIEISERIPYKVTGITSLFIKTDYNEAIINIIKNCDMAVYHKKLKLWEATINNLEYLITNLTYLDDMKLFLLKPEKKEDVYTNKVKYKTKPFDYQLEGIKFGLNNSKFLLLDGMGLGKTLQAIYLAEELALQKSVEHCLIICGINALKLNWKKEIQKHSSKSCMILGEKKTKHGDIKYNSSINDRLQQLEQPINSFFVITNIETLRDDRIVKAINEGPNKFDFVVCDELHKMKSKSSLQGNNLLKIQAPFKMGLTGTLILNNPLDTYVPLAWIGATKATLTNFSRFYCRYDINRHIIGFKHIDMLKKEIEHCSLRRTKDILNLPPKNIIDEFIIMNDDHMKFYNDVAHGIKDNINKVELKPNNVLSLITRLRQAATCPSVLTTESINNSKLERCVELISDILEEGEKVVVVSSFKEPLYELKARLADKKVLMGTGDIKDKEFSENIDLFQTDDSYKIFLGTSSKMGTGVTLTAASYMIMLDSSWTAALNTQCEDRIYRYGTSKSVFIYYLWCNDTIDMFINNLVHRKSALSDYIVDNKSDNDIIENLRKYIEDL